MRSLLNQMEETLTRQDKVFVKELITDGNQTKAAKKAYGYKDDNVAGVMAHKKLRKVKIQKAIKSIADSISDDKLIRVLNEGLEASDKIYKDGEVVDEKPDYAVRHKYLDSGLKIKGAYAPEKSIAINLEVEEATLREIIKGIRG